MQGWTEGDVRFKNPRTGLGDSLDGEFDDEDPNLYRTRSERSEEEGDLDLEESLWKKININSTIL